MNPSALPSRQAEFHPDEWAARVQLAACYRVFDLLGWTELVYNHVSLRVPGAPQQLLLNRFGLHYREVRASNLVKIDLAGRVLEPPGAPVNAAAVAPHTAIHAAIAACTQGGLAQNNFYSAQLHDMVAYHDFEGITVHAEEAPRLLANLGNKPLLILRNHGLLSWASTLALAFVRLWTLQRACEIQVAQAALGPAIAVSEAPARPPHGDPARRQGPRRFRGMEAAGGPDRPQLARLMLKSGPPRSPRACRTVPSRPIHLGQCRA